MAEWLRREPGELVGSARAGSNPAPGAPEIFLFVNFLIILMKGKKVRFLIPFLFIGMGIGFLLETLGSILLFMASMFVGLGVGILLDMINRLNNSRSFVHLVIGAPIVFFGLLMAFLGLSTYILNGVIGFLVVLVGACFISLNKKI